MKRGMMGVIIAVGLSVGAFAQNYNSQPNINPSQPNTNGMQNQNNNGIQNNNGSNNLTNPVPGSTQQQPLITPGSGTNNEINRQNNSSINNSGVTTSPTDQASTKGQQPNIDQGNRTTNPSLNNNQSRGDSLLKNSVEEVSPFENNGHEPGFLNQNLNISTDQYLAMANFPDPTKKGKQSATKASSVRANEPVENAALKERYKTANAVPDWVQRKGAQARRNEEPSNASCALNNELNSRQGSFKDKMDFHDGELFISRERDGEEKVKFNSKTEFYKFEKTEKGKEKFAYGVTKDYETMELKKNEDGTAEIMYHGIFPNINDAEDAIMNGIVVEEMGNACRGVYKD